MKPCLGEICVAWIEQDVRLQWIFGLAARHESEHDMAVRAEWLGEADGWAGLVRAEIIEWEGDQNDFTARHRTACRH